MEHPFFSQNFFMGFVLKFLTLVFGKNDAGEVGALRIALKFLL